MGSESVRKKYGHLDLCGVWISANVSTPAASCMSGIAHACGACAVSKKPKMQQGEEQFALRMWRCGSDRAGCFDLLLPLLLLLLLLFVLLLLLLLLLVLVLVLVLVLLLMWLLLLLLLLLQLLPLPCVTARDIKIM